MGDGWGKSGKSEQRRDGDWKRVWSKEAARKILHIVHEKNRDRETHTSGVGKTVEERLGKVHKEEVKIGSVHRCW
jgi:hypothetical protein